jgi:hypothetical protein
VHAVQSAAQQRQYAADRHEGVAAETLKVHRKPGSAHGGVTSSSSTSGRPPMR